MEIGQQYRGWTVAIVPFPALGDLTIYLRMAQSWMDAGARVFYFSDQLSAASNRFDWLEVKPLAEVSPQQLAVTYDLVLWDAGVGELKADELVPPNVAFVTSKRLPEWMRGRTESLEVRDQVFGGRYAAFCEDSDLGRHMVAWVDHFLQKTFGLRPAKESPRVAFAPQECSQRRRVAIFPTTPNPKKNYSPCGFRKMANRLSRRGWHVSIIGTPGEHAILVRDYPELEVLSFHTLNELIGFLASCPLVVSNDSGGGHLASMLGLSTVTITRKSAAFTWRPGFNSRNTVLSPLLTFKLGKGHIWRPFIPWWRITELAEQAYGVDRAVQGNGP